MPRRPELTQRIPSRSRSRKKAPCEIHRIQHEFDGSRTISCSLDTPSAKVAFDLISLVEPFWRKYSCATNSELWTPTSRMEVHSFVAKSFDELGIRSRELICSGHQGNVYEVTYQRGVGPLCRAALKVPQVGGICIMDLCPDEHNLQLPNASLNQRWLWVPCPGDPDYSFLCHELMGDKVLGIFGESHLVMSEFIGGDHQKWCLDGDARLLNKSKSYGRSENGICMDVSEGLDVHGSPVIVYSRDEKNIKGNQRWDVQVVVADLGLCLVQIISRMEGRRALTIRSGHQIYCENMCEVQRLAKWSRESGLVQLQRVVWAGGVPRGIVMERLGKQLGRGTGHPSMDCILQDLRNGIMHFTACDAARCLGPVAELLCRMHGDGYVHNDLHDGNILAQDREDSFKLIDLGSVTRADHWTTQLGAPYDVSWSTSRDWRAFTVAFIGLVSCGTQLSVWDFVGTNDATCSPDGGPLPWSPPVTEVTSGIPQNVHEMIRESNQIQKDAEFAELLNVLQALFSSRVNGPEVCAKLRNLAAAQ